LEVKQVGSGWLARSGDYTLTRANPDIGGGYLGLVCGDSGWELRYFRTREEVLEDERFGLMALVGDGWWSER
jgi:hypothetical protein